MNSITINDDFSGILRNVAIQNMMSTQVVSAYEGWSIRRLSDFFAKHNISGAPVIASDDTLVGVVTQSDIVRFTNQKPSDKEVNKIIEHYCGPTRRTIEPDELNKIQEKAFDYMTVNSIMTKHVISIDKSSSLYDAYRDIIDNDVHRIFVLDKGVLVGVVTAMDILKTLAA